MPGEESDNSALIFGTPYIGNIAVTRLGNQVPFLLKGCKIVEDTTAKPGTRTRTIRRSVFMIGRSDRQCLPMQIMSDVTRRSEKVQCQRIFSE
jgi:hypothetical protein